MIHLNPKSLKIKKAKHKFYHEMEELVFKRIDKINSIKDINTSIAIRLFDEFICPVFEDILIGSPKRLIELHEKIQPIIEISDDFKTAIEYVFRYDKWFIKKVKNRYDAYNLAQSLDVSSCVYCNRNYTNTVITKKGEKLSRPQFDHYFDKSSHLLLAISFYNLIPSCSTCNSSIKHSASFELKSHIHPYLDDTIDKISFSYKYDIDTKDGLKILVTSPLCSRTETSIKEFALQEVYNEHTDILKDLIQTKQAFSDRYLGTLSSNLLPGVIVSKEELYRMVFGTELLKTNFAKRPFSKFKKDILNELEIIAEDE